MKLIGITFSTRLDEAQLTKHAHRENCVTDKVEGWESYIHSKPLQESSILSVMGKQCNGDHGAECQYLISDTLMMHIMMSIYKEYPISPGPKACKLKLFKTKS